ncbi:MAG: substrate-binding domain-containing protein [Planctomycetes bacterium]|nr:substrate-binding domain-containing protein [Planctomycetota bacterium]
MPIRTSRALAHSTRALLCFSLAFLVASSLTSCTPSGSKSADGKKRIGVSLLTQQHDFYKDLQAGLEEAAAEHGFEVVIQSGENDSPAQARQLQAFITQGVDAIIVCPCDSAAVVPTIKRANQGGIPVFTADIAAAGGEVVSHIASDNFQGGELAAEALVRFMGESGEVIVLDHPEVESVQQRVQGFEEGIAKHPNITIVDKPSAGGKRDQAFKMMQNKLQSNPNLRGVFAINDDTALGALRAAGDHDLVIIGYDATPEAREKITADTQLKADVVQSPKTIGRKTIEAIADHFAGKTPPKVIPVEVGVVDR